MFRFLWFLKHKTWVVKTAGSINGIFNHKLLFLGLCPTSCLNFFFFLVEMTDFVGFLCS